jgi:hypothetical protein
MALLVPSSAGTNQAGWNRAVADTLNGLVRKRLVETTITAATTLTDDYDVYLCDASGAAFTVTLPKAGLYSGKLYYLKKIDSSANAITIDADGSETIDGSATQSIDNQYQTITLFSDGTGWNVVPISPTLGAVSVTNALTFASSGGAAAGTTFDGSSAVTVDYSTVGAAKTGAATGSGLTIATSHLLGRASASTGAIEELTLSQALDLIGSAAHGDLLFRGASGWQRLAAGTSGQFLKTLGAGADPAWDTPSGGAGGSFRGALVTRAAQQSGANYSGVVAIAWDSEVYDTDGIHDPVTNNTRLTVPSGVTKVRLQANVDMTSVTASSDTVVFINKNGATFTGTPRQRLNAGVTVPSHNIATAVVTVSAGDYFELVLFSADTSIDIRIADGASWFAMEIIE